MSWLRRHPALLGAITVGVGLRLSIILLFPEMRLAGDEEVYYRAATNLAAGKDVSAFPFRSPLYIFLCAWVVKLGGPGGDGIRLFQIGLEGLSILGIFLLARRILGERVAPCAAWLYALYPDFIAYSHYLWSETLGLLLLIWGLLTLTWLRDRPEPRWALLAGLAWGLAGLNKPASLYLALPLLAWVAYSIDSRSRIATLRLAAIAFSTSLIVIAPWSLHLSLKLDRPILVSTTGAHNLRIGNNNYEPPHYDFPTRNTYSRAKAKKLGRSVGLVRWISAHPRLFAERAVLKMKYLWSPTSFPVRHIFWGRYGYTVQRGPTPPLLAVACLVMISTVAMLSLSIPGFFASRLRQPFAFGLTTAYVSTYLAMITLTPALSRYRLPLMVFAVLYAAFLLADRGELPRRLLRPATAIPTVVVLAALVALWWNEVPLLAEAIRQSWEASSS